MAGVTEEEIARAKELDLLTYFKLVEPGNLKLVGKEYRHKVHSSLTISKDSLWCWHCIGLRGRTALKYLIDVEKVPYVEAVREINRIQGGVVRSSQPVSLPQPRAEPQAPRDFKLPEPDTNSYAAMAYLRGRCIHPNVLAFCRKEGILYQTSFKNHPNCVFVGRDGEGVAKGGSLRGCTQLQFRRDIPGSKKIYPFYIQAGTDYAALDAFLKYFPAVRKIVLCLDNDNAGRTRTQDIIANLAGSGKAVEDRPPPVGKDYNDTLVQYMQAIANQKGGTGKTTTTYNLGIALTQQGYRVLMVDFDPQGNLSCYCGIPPEKDLDQTITELLMKTSCEKPIGNRECIYQTGRKEAAARVDFIPSNLRLAGFELAMGTMMCREVLLKSCLEQYNNQYDYCLIDCSPSVGLLLTNALAAANEIIIPMQAQPFSVVGMSQLTSSIANVQRKINPGLRVKGILLTMTEHTNVSDHYCGQVRSTYGNKIHVFTTEIPRNVKVQESQANAEPTILYDPKSNSAKAYIEFAKEVSGYGREEQVFERDEDALNR